VSGGLLDRILADKRERLARDEYAPSPRPPSRPPDGASFVRALREPGVRIVAEIKGRSPSAGEILRDADGRLETMALAYRRGRAAALSVVVEEDHFGGRPEWLPRARSMSGLPALLKDFILAERQLDWAASLGADAVLLLARALSDEELARLREGARRRALAVVVEAHDAAEIARAVAVAPEVVGVNARNLADFSTDLARAAGLAAAITAGPVRLAESGVRSREDIETLSAAGYEAFLVGETLLRSEDPEETLRDLRR
jgi:indole-3-glycerol phosphate synthase